MNLLPANVLRQVNPRIYQMVCNSWTPDVYDVYQVKAKGQMKWEQKCILTPYEARDVELAKRDTRVEIIPLLSAEHLKHMIMDMTHSKLEVSMGDDTYSFRLNSDLLWTTVAATELETLWVYYQELATKQISKTA